MAVERSCCKQDRRICNLCDNAAFPRSNKEFSSSVNSETSRMSHVKMKGGSDQEEARAVDGVAALGVLRVCWRRKDLLSIVLKHVRDRNSMAMFWGASKLTRYRCYLLVFAEACSCHKRRGNMKTTTTEHASNHKNKNRPCRTGLSRRRHGARGCWAERLRYRSARRHQLVPGSQRRD